MEWCMEHRRWKAIRRRQNFGFLSRSSLKRQKLIAAVPIEEEHRYAVVMTQGIWRSVNILGAFLHNSLLQLYMAATLLPTRHKDNRTMEEWLLSSVAS